MLRCLMLVLPALALPGLSCLNPQSPEEEETKRGMVLVAGGSFWMGDTSWSTDEIPPHPVTISAFWMDTTEVTREGYTELMSATYEGFSGPDWGEYGAGENYPAHSVSWYDAVLYCNGRTKQAGRSDTVYRFSSIEGTPGNGCVLSDLRVDLAKDGYRLPTEAEWEYACRAGTETDHYWASRGIDHFAWYYANSGSSAQPVGRKHANAFGLHDMSGNVWEWCNDWYGFYERGSVHDPAGPAEGLERVLRGGDWNNFPSDLRSARRFYDLPHNTPSFAGFRVVRPAR